MKKMMICAAMLAAMCGLVSCGEENEQPAEGSRTGFALKFLKNVAATVPAAENVVISPYSAGAALSMLLEMIGDSIRSPSLKPSLSMIVAMRSEANKRISLSSRET